MKVCLICEGSYPYVAGGVASWVQMLCTASPDIEFVIWSIATTKEEMHEYKYKLPENITEVRTIYLGEDTFGKTHRSVRISKIEKKILRQLVLKTSDKINWRNTFKFIKRYHNRLVDILMERDFFDICLEEYQNKESDECFKDYLWNMRGMFFPLMDILSGDIVEADIYHSLSTGYAGILGSAASYIKKKPLLLSEHGIYTREREEDIIRAEWVAGEFKELWIDFFRKISLLAYEQASVVTTLFSVNKTLQIELGCPEEKIQIIPNGVDSDSFENMESCGRLDRSKFNISTILRVVPIKDVKTMLLAYQLVREQEKNIKLSILGNFDENPEYYMECVQLIRELGIEEVEFMGQVNIKEYLPDIDLLILSSISEGQPFAILEGLAAGVPFVSTNVGDCRELLEGGQGDELGRAGIVVPLMDSEAMAEAILYGIHHPDELKKMGEVGKMRVRRNYRKKDFLEKYHELYDMLGGK